MPNGTEVQVGYLAPQSKQIFDAHTVSIEKGPRPEIQDLYLDGRKDDAAKAVPDDLVRAVSLLGTEEQVREQLGELHAAGVTTLLTTPLAATAEQRIDDIATLSRLTGELG